MLVVENASDPREEQRRLEGAIAKAKTTLEQSKALAFATSPEDAERLTIATRYEPVRLALRNYRDEEVVRTAGVATKALFNTIQENIAARSRKVLEDRLTTATSINELRSYMEQKKLVRINWCGDFNCAERLKEQVSGEIRGTLWDHKEEPTGPCIACGDPAKSVAYVSRTY